MGWVTTNLSVTPPSYQMGSRDVQSIEFNAGEAITASSHATIVDIEVGGTPVAIPVSVVSPSVTVTVDAPDLGLERDHIYEIAVTFYGGGGKRWTRTLVIEVVA